jgi:hypothetical protein
VPLKYGPDAYNYPYVLSIGFIGDGTTVDDVARTNFLDGCRRGIRRRAPGSSSPAAGCWFAVTASP